MTRFRLQRCLTLETETMFLEANKHWDKVEDEWTDITHNTHLAIAVRSLLGTTRTLDHYRRYEAALRRTIDRAVKELERIQNNRLSGPSGRPPAPNTKLRNDATEPPPASPPSPTGELVPMAAYPATRPLRPTLQQCYFSTCNMANTSIVSTISPAESYAMIHGYEFPVTPFVPKGLISPKVNFC